MFIPTLQSFHSLGFHLGQSHDKWKPNVVSYILGFRYSYTIHMLDKSFMLFRLAFLFLKSISSLKLPLFIFSGKNYNSFYSFLLGSSVFSFLLIVPGILTNFKIVSRFLLKVRRVFFPSVVFCSVINPSLGFVREAQYLGVPLIAPVDSTVGYLEDITYPLLLTVQNTTTFLIRLFRLFGGFSSINFQKKRKAKLNSMPFTNNIFALRKKRVSLVIKKFKRK